MKDRWEFIESVQSDMREPAIQIESRPRLLCTNANSACHPYWMTSRLLGDFGWLGRWYMLHRGSNCPLSQAMYGCIMLRGTISSCQSASTSKIVKRCGAQVSSALPSNAVRQIQPDLSYGQFRRSLKTFPFFIVGPIATCVNCALETLSLTYLLTFTARRRQRWAIFFRLL